MRLRRFLVFLGCSLFSISQGRCLAATPLAELREKANQVDAQTGGKDWKEAEIGQQFELRDRVRTGDEGRAGLLAGAEKFIRLRSNSLFTVVPPLLLGHDMGIELQRGEIYVFSREKLELEVRTPGGIGRPQSTEFLVRVGEGGRSEFVMFQGSLRLSNAQGEIELDSNDDARRAGVALPGMKPYYTARLDAVRARDLAQWCLYYPGVLDLQEIGFEKTRAGKLQAVVDAYQAGDLLKALAVWPPGYRPRTDGENLLRAATLLSVGEVERARALIASVSTRSPGRLALEQLITAVQFRGVPRTNAVHTASEWLAESYVRQSLADIDGALRAAEEAVRLSPNFGFARVRVAELQFSRGHTPAALREIERGFLLSPRNAQAHALHGFLLAAGNRIGAAREAFETAIGIDSGLANAWLGRGLSAIRQNRHEEGRRDLETAAALEPTRAVLRSYLAKAFADENKADLAASELDIAETLDPSDPTSSLYRALLLQQQNRYNEAVGNLETSIRKNENRRLYRSRFLLDQDRAVRRANLASIYLNDGMIEQSVREAVRAVNNDYGSAPAHLFLANSYNALRDPTRILLRYETAWFNELLLANLLSPVGGGPLSQFVSQQEYSKLFESDRLGISSTTDYFSYGELRETASQYGTFGNISYALDAEYFYNNGIRPNNEISRLDTYGTFKLQVGTQDTVFFQTKFGDSQYGDIFQRYNPNLQNVAALTNDFRERQEPGLLLAGWHHEWAPGNHTVLLLGRLANDQVKTAEDTTQFAVTRELSHPTSERLDLLLPSFNPFDPEQTQLARKELNKSKQSGEPIRIDHPAFDLDTRSNFETYTGELSQIITSEHHSIVLGSRFQFGQFNTQVLLTDFANGLDPIREIAYSQPPADQNVTVDFERINLYAYDTWRIAPRLALTGGLTYDKLRYPENFRNPPVNDRQKSLEKISPKAGFIASPWEGSVVRGAYSEAISGSSFDESIRLEPTQVAGFLQAYRTVISESVIGSVAGSEYKLWGLSIEQRLPSRTYLGLEYAILEQDVERTIGAFDVFTFNGRRVAALPGSFEEKDVYREDVLAATVNQLLGERWSAGLRYRYSRSKLRRERSEFSDAFDDIQTADLATLLAEADKLSKSSLHELSVFGLYNHPTGFFARAEANWYHQDNDDYAAALSGSNTSDGANPRFRTNNSGDPGDDFWQFNAYAGWRFFRNQCEISAGVLNIADTDYHLNPLNYYLELPRERTLLVRVKFTF